jgi:hypothetical protein
MMRRNGLATRAFSIGLTVWFVWLTASVHLLHTHPLNDCCDGDFPAGMHAVHVDDPASSGPRSADRGTGLCPACLFLAKYAADGCPALPDVVRDDSVPSCTASSPVTPAVAVEWPTTAPRAPPVRSI